MRVGQTCLIPILLGGCWVLPGVATADDNKPVSSLPITGQQQSLLVELDAAMLELMQLQEVPGASLAVSYRGRLMYARGFGFADIETKRPVRPESLFRIASISKPITAVAILRLVEQQKLRLDDKVFEVLERKLSAAADPRLADVTVLHCLEHSGGWDRDKSFDPMFRSVAFAAALGVPPPAKAADVIRCMADVPLDFAPGERFAYSNFGYCLLGRVIEKLTGLAYDDYVQAEVLRPVGIHRMRLGKTLLAERADDEVRYYDEATGPAVVGETIGQMVPLPYGAWYLEAMDSHGGWIASAQDLVRFAAALDDPQRCCILKGTSIERMFARPDGLLGNDEQGVPKPVYYACGWNVRPVDEGRSNTWHTGSLPGTSTLLVRRHDGIDWAVLFNRRDGKEGGRLSTHADKRINQAISGIETWPDGDGFTAAP